MLFPARDKAHESNTLCQASRHPLRIRIRYVDPTDCGCERPLGQRLAPGFHDACLTAEALDHPSECRVVIMFGQGQHENRSQSAERPHRARMMVIFCSAVTSAPALLAAFLYRTGKKANHA